MKIITTCTIKTDDGYLYPGEQDIPAKLAKQLLADGLATEPETTPAPPAEQPDGNQT